MPEIKELGPGPDKEPVLWDVKSNPGHVIDYEGYTWPVHPYTEPVSMLSADGVVEIFERRMDVAWNNMRIMVGGTSIRDMVARMKTSRYWAQRYYRFKRKNPALVQMYWQGSLDEPTGPSLWSTRTDVSGSPG